MLKPPTTLVTYTAMCVLANYRERTGDSDWEEIHEMTGLSRTVIYRALGALKDGGVIVLREDGSYWMPMDEPVEKSPNRGTPEQSESQSRDSKSQSRDGSVPIAGFAPLSTEITESSSEKTAPLALVQEADPLLGFDKFWEAYPKRNGKRIHRGVCEGIWKKLSLDDRRAAYRGAHFYAVAVANDMTIACDPERFLKRRDWVDWQEPASASPAPQRQRPASTSRDGRSLLELAADVARAEGGA